MNNTTDENEIKNVPSTEEQNVEKIEEPNKEKEKKKSRFDKPENDIDVESIRKNVHAIMQNIEKESVGMEVEIAPNSPEKKKKFKTRYILDDADRMSYEMEEEAKKKARKTRKSKKKVSDEQNEAEPKQFIDKTVEGVPDWGVYKRNYGSPYSFIRKVSIVGIAYYIFALILSLNGIEWTYGHSAIKWVVEVVCTACIIGLPFSFIMPIISFKRFSHNHVLFEPEQITYFKSQVKGNTPEGYLESHEEYIIKRIRLLTEMVGYFRVKGVVERYTVVNGKRSKKQLFKTCIIPKAFTNLELVEKYIMGGENEYHYVKFIDLDEEEYRRGGMRRQSSYYKKYKKY